MSDDVKFSIGAEDTGFGAQLNKAREQAVEASESIKASFEKLSGTFEKVQKIFLAFSAALAGGHAFKEVISGSVEWTEGSKKLANALGVSLEKASDYQVALRHLGIDNEVVTSAVEKMSKQIYSNSAAFDTLGVTIKEANGEFRPAGDILQNVIDKLRGITDPIARNIAGQQIFGKGWAELRPILKLTSDELEKATVRARELGLEVGEAQEQNVKKFQQSLRDVGLVGTSLSVKLGNELIPALTQVGAAFAGHGAEIGAVFAEALRGIAFVAGTVAIQFEKMGKGIGALGAAAAAVLHGDLAGAKAIMADLKGDVAALNAEAAGLWDKLHKPAPKPEEDKPELTGGPFDPREKNASEMAALEQKLAAFKANFAEQLAAQGTFGELSKAEERAYWEAILQRKDLSKNDRIAIEKKVAAETLAITKTAYVDELAAIKAREASYRNDLEAKLAIAKGYAAKVAAAEGGDSKAGVEATSNVLTVERELAAQKIKIAETGAKEREALALYQLDAEESAARQSEQLGLETKAKLLAQAADFEDRRFVIKHAALQKAEIAAKTGPDQNPARAAEIHGQLESLEQSHALKMQTIGNQTVMEQSRTWGQMFSTMQSGFASVLQRFMTGAASLTQTVRGLFAAVASSVANTLAQLAAHNIATMIQQAAVGKSLRAKEIMQDASKAASGAYAAIVGIPYVGPFLAPAAAAVAYAGVMAFDSAEGGYDIPSNVNPIVQTHKNEMILPAKYADTIRNLADNGGGGGDTHHWHVQATDAPSFERMLMKSKATIGKAAVAHLRSSGHLAPGH